MTSPFGSTPEQAMCCKAGPALAIYVRLGAGRSLKHTFSGCGIWEGSRLKSKSGTRYKRRLVVAADASLSIRDLHLQASPKVHEKRDRESGSCMVCTKAHHQMVESLAIFDWHQHMNTGCNDVVAWLKQMDTALNRKRDLIYYTTSWVSLAKPVFETEIQTSMKPKPHSFKPISIHGPLFSLIRGDRTGSVKFFDPQRGFGFIQSEGEAGPGRLYCEADLQVYMGRSFLLRVPLFLRWFQGSSGLGVRV